ncbi:MAG TPA: NACHT domain-containing protein, partial [Longimicrobium sp.]|nr:NACHT domain-containing protein [Longimicrobium sp.]
SGALATAGGIAPEGSEDAGEAPEVARHEVEAELDGLLRGFGPPTAPRPVYRELTVSLPREPVLATDPEDALILDCAAQLTAPGLMVAWEALSQTFAMDCAARIETLVEPAPTSGHEPEEYVAPTVKGAWAGSQREVCEKLLELCRGKRLAPLRAVVTGDAGVGKSSALRRLTRTLTLEYLASPDTGTPQPIHLPLAFVTMSSPHFQALGTAGPRDRGKALHDALLGWWCEWFDRVTFPGAVRPDWVMERLRTKPIVFILDGVDELLTNNPIVGAADFRQYLQYLTSRNALNPRLTIVLGVRSSQPGLASLASDSGQIYEILRLTPAQAVAQFPAAGDWVRSIRSPQLKKLVLRPLLLAQLDSRAGSLVDEQSATRAELLERALRRLVELSGLGTRPDASGAPSEPSQWMSALMLVAWRMLTGGRGDLPVNRLAEEAREAAAAWTRHLEATGQRESAESLLSGFELLCAPESRDALLRRTVLYPSGEGAIRFIHREWQDFLTARYFAECVTRRNVDELGHVAFTVPMYVTAGELLSHQRIEAELVKEALKREGAARVYVLGNLAALIGNSTSPISGPALELILRGLGTMNVLSRVVTITGFGHRALRQAPEDSSVSDVREYLAAALRKHVLGAEAGGTDALARSLAWCHLRAFHQVSGGPPPAGPWPRLGAAPEHEHEALALICDPTQDPPDVTPRHRSLQAAFLQLLGL